MATKIHNLVRVSDLRKDLARYLRDAKKKPVVVSTDRGGDTRVLMSAELYNKLVEAYEDAMDSAELERLVAEDDGVRIPLHELRKEYGL